MILKNASSEWMSISDMMSGLMLIFLFIAISFMVKIESEKEEMKNVAKSYRDEKANLNESLYSEFEGDLERWHATITSENSIVFDAPEVLFEVSKSEIRDEFKVILADFFPRYLKLLTSQEYKNSVAELRVEGHTSDKWSKESTQQEIYLNNMKLSQSRAYNVLAYCYSLDINNTQKAKVWLEKHFRANGVAFSKMEDEQHARRVEFVLQMKSEETIFNVLKK